MGFVGTCGINNLSNVVNRHCFGIQAELSKEDRRQLITEMFYKLHAKYRSGNRRFVDKLFTVKDENERTVQPSNLYAEEFDNYFNQIRQFVHQTDSETTVYDDSATIEAFGNNERISHITDDQTFSLSYSCSAIWGRRIHIRTRDRSPQINKVLMRIIARWTPKIQCSIVEFTVTFPRSTAK